MQLLNVCMEEGLFLVACHGACVRGVKLMDGISSHANQQD